MSKLIDLTNQKFGRLTVLSKDLERKTNNGSYWICECECGKIKSIKSSSLRRGEIQSCGCLRNERQKAGKHKTSEEKMIGQRFGYLTVKSKSDKDNKNSSLWWWCECDCGRMVEVKGSNLTRTDNNRTVSCGCKHRSIGANNILNILNENNIIFIDEYRFLELPKFRYDFAIIENNKVIRLIEFDGEQHYKDIPTWGGLELQQKRDNIKNQFAKDNNIPLVRIPYWERDNITLDMIMGNQYLI